MGILSCGVERGIGALSAGSITSEGGAASGIDVSGAASGSGALSDGDAPLGARGPIGGGAAPQDSQPCASGARTGSVPPLALSARIRTGKGTGARVSVRAGVESLLPQPTAALAMMM